MGFMLKFSFYILLGFGFLQIAFCLLRIFGTPSCVMASPHRAQETLCSARNRTKVSYMQSKSLC